MTPVLGLSQGRGDNHERMMMTDKERIDRLERVVGTLISWLHRELGTDAAKKLLEKLGAEP